MSRGKITQPLLDTPGIVKAVNPREYSLSQLIAGCEVPEMDALFLQGGEEALCLGVVTRHTDTGKALVDAIKLQSVAEALRRVLASAV